MLATHLRCRELETPAQEADADCSARRDKARIRCLQLQGEVRIDPIRRRAESRA